LWLILLILHPDRKQMFDLILKSLIDTLQRQLAETLTILVIDASRRLR